MGGKAAVAGGLVMGLLAGAIIVGGVVVLAPDPTVPVPGPTVDPGGASPSAPVAAPSGPVTAAPSVPVTASPSPVPSSSAAPSPEPSSSAVPSGEPGSSASASAAVSAGRDGYWAGSPAPPLTVAMLGRVEIDRAEIVRRGRSAG